MRVLLLLACLCGAAVAATGIPSQVLSHEGPVAVVQVESVGKDGVIAVKVIAPSGAALPGQLSLYQRGPVRHTFEVGMLAVVTLQETALGWRYAPIGERIVTTDRPTRRALARFLVRAREAANLSPSARLDLWLQSLDHASALARQLAFEQLMTHRLTFRPLFGVERVGRVGTFLTEPGVAPEEADLAMRLLIAYANESVVRWIDTHWTMLRTDRLRLQAVGALNNVKSAVSDAALNRCAREATGVIQTRCLRAQLRRQKARP